MAYAYTKTFAHAEAASYADATDVPGKLIGIADVERREEARPALIRHLKDLRRSVQLFHSRIAAAKETKQTH